MFCFPILVLLLCKGSLFTTPAGALLNSLSLSVLLLLFSWFRLRAFWTDTRRKIRSGQLYNIQATKQQQQQAHTHTQKKKTLWEQRHEQLAHRIKKERLTCENKGSIFRRRGRQDRKAKSARPSLTPVLLIVSACRYPGYFIAILFLFCCCCCRFVTGLEYRIQCAQRGRCRSRPFRPFFCFLFFSHTLSLPFHRRRFFCASKGVPSETEPPFAFSPFIHSFRCAFGFVFVFCFLACTLHNAHIHTYSLTCSKNSSPSRAHPLCPSLFLSFLLSDYLFCRVFFFVLYGRAL